MAKFYAVARGRRTGIFDSWSGPDGAQAQVDGFHGARHRSFPTRGAAEEWLASLPQAPAAPTAGLASGSPASRPVRPVSPDATPAAGPGASVPANAFPAAAPEIAVHLHAVATAPLGVGAYAVILLHDGREAALSGALAQTTANRQHLQGLHEALAFLKCPCRITVHTASGYARDRMDDGRLAYWRSHNWDNADGSPVQHADWWHRLVPLLDRHQVTFTVPAAGYDERLRAAAATAMEAVPLGADYAQPPWQAAAPE